MITVEQFYSACKDIEKNLREIVGIETDTLSWIIQKIDFCYNWKLNSQDELNTYLKIFQNLEYSRKDRYIYDTSVMYTGSAYTVKAYSKYEEYLKHDLKELEKVNPMLAYEVMELAKNVLRFEVSLKKQQFQTVFGKQTLHIADITEEVITTHLTMPILFVGQSILFIRLYRNKNLESSSIILFNDNEIHGCYSRRRIFEEVV